MKKLIDFHPVVIKKIEDIMEKEGHKTFTGALFATVSSYYDKKYFTKYKGPDIKIIAEVKLTPQQYCESKGGKVVVENGLDRCLVIQGSITRSFPLERVEEFI